MVNKMESMEEIKRRIHVAIEEVQDKMPPKAAPLVEEALIKMETENLTAREVMGISQDVMEEIYEHGYHFFQSGKYKDALPIFNVLCQLDGGLDPRYTFAIAACHHHMKNYIEAIGYYMLYEVLDPTNPLPYYHMYDCFKKLNQSEMAFNVLAAAEHLADEDPKYAELKNKIELELKHLKSLEGSNVA